MTGFNPHDPNADPATPVNTPTRVNGQVVILEYDPAWPAMYEEQASNIREALGDRVLLLEHIGSTAVPGLPAKPCIDMLLVVADPDDEPAWVPDLEATGFVLRIREPERNGHRVFKGRDVNLNLHVWRIGDPQIDRHLAFRDWLREHDDDRDRYAAAKRDLATRHWDLLQDYADAKNDIVQEIQQRMAAAT